jgi:UDP-N-acetyl-D-glucosamine dehydrogenase
MPSVVTSLVAEGLNRASRSIRGSKVLILGVAYKKNVSDCRESPALDVMRMLSDKGALLSYNDPFVPAVRLGGQMLASTGLSAPTIESQDCVIILTDHSTYDFRSILKSARLVIDTRNATKDLPEFRDRIIKLGAGSSRAAPLEHEDGHDVASTVIATN